MQIFEHVPVNLEVDPLKKHRDLLLVACVVPKLGLVCAGVTVEPVVAIVEKIVGC